MDKIKTLTEDEVKQYESLPTKYYVYLMTNLLNGKIYVGVRKSKLKNILDDKYWGSGDAIKSAIRIYGIENFKKQIIAIFDNRKDALELEKEIVNADFVASKMTYNLARGGNCDLERLNMPPKKRGQVWIKNELLQKDTHLFEDSAEFKEKMADGWVYGRIEGRTFNTDTEAYKERNKKMSEIISGRVWLKDEVTQQCRMVEPNSEIYNALKSQGWVEGCIRPNHHTWETEGFIWIRNETTNERKLLDPNTIECEQLLNNGWVIGMGLTDAKREFYESRKGLIWIKNVELNKSKVIDPSELNDYLKKGWSRGKIHNDKGNNAGTVWLINKETGKTAHVKKDSDEYNALLKQGFENGRGFTHKGEIRKKMSEDKKGRVWLTNLETFELRMVKKESDLFNELLNSGFVLGRKLLKCPQK